MHKSAQKRIEAQQESNAAGFLLGRSSKVTSNGNEVAGWLTNVQRKQLPFATAGALTDTAFDVRKHVVEKTFPRDFDLKNKRFAAATLRVDKASKRKLSAAVYDRLGREYLETQTRGGIKKPRGQWISIPTQHIKRTASGKIGKAKRPRKIVNKPNVFFRHQGPTPDIVRRPRGKGKQLEVLYQLVPLARIPRRLRFYEDAAKVVQRRMVPNFKKSFERAVALPKEVQHWLLATLREKLVKIGAKVIRHGRYVTFQMKRHRF